MPRAAHREARAWFEQALRALGHLPQTRETIQLAIDLRFDLWSALAPLGELAAILHRLRECEPLAEALGDRQRLGRLLARMPETLGLIGDYERAIEVSERGIALAEELNDRVIESVATRNLGAVYHFLGDYRRAVVWLKRSVASVEGNLRYEYFGAPLLLSVISRTWLVWSLADVGEFAEGMTVAEDALQIAERIGHPLNLVSAHLGFGLVHLRKGELATATAALKRSFGILQGSSISGWFNMVASPLGLAYALTGRLDRALPLLEEAMQDAIGTRKVTHQSLNVAHLGEGYLLAGRLNDANALSQRALGLSLKHKQRGNQGWALRLLGEVAAGRDPPHVKDAVKYYGQGMTLADELGMRPPIAHCCLGLGRLHRRMGKRQEAQEHLTTATTMYREMDMRFWLAQAEAAMDEAPR